MAESAVSFVAQKIYDLLVEEVTLLSGIRSQVHDLERELCHMQEFIKAAESGRKSNVAVREWVRDIIDVAYDAEDIIDIFLLKMERSRGQRSGLGVLVKRCTFIVHKFTIRHKLGKQIQRLQSRIQRISEWKKMYAIESDNGSRGGEPRWGTANSSGKQLDRVVQERRRLAIEIDTNIVGFEDVRSELVEMLLNKYKDKRRRCVISIVGMGGSGKTTIARKVCHDSLVRRSFNCIILVTVSQEYSVDKILANIMENLVRKEAVRKMGRLELREKLWELLEVKKYLIVMDDVWTTDLWNNIKSFLPDPKNGSRVMITTRSIQVARSADSFVPPFELRLLRDDESWEIFNRVVFQTEDDEYTKQDYYADEELEKWGRRMMNCCGGLPLALIVLGGLLSNREKTPMEWRKVAESIDWEHIREGQVCLQILALSYEDLPYSLKLCFLYFSSFPEDFKVDAQKLILLWVAEGFIPQTATLERNSQYGKSSKTMEEIAEACLEDLIQRCMVQAVRRDNGTRRVLVCRVHDMLRELSIKEAREVSFFNAPHTDHVDHQYQATPVATRTRRLALHMEYLQPHDLSIQKVRTLLYCHWYSRIQKGSLLALLKRLDLIRVLDLELADLQEVIFPKEIGDLIHLRFLGLNRTLVKSIPQSIGRLQKLQTLAVFQTSIDRLPNTLQKVGTLRHLFLGAHMELDKGFGRSLVNLQTLDVAGAGRWIESSLAAMTNLRTLKISYIKKSHHLALSISLQKLLHLQTLHLSGETLPNNVLTILSNNHHLQQLHFLEWSDEWAPQSPPLCNDDLQLPPNLLSITLVACSRLHQDLLALLEKLRYLRYLQLGDSAYEGEVMACSADGFPHLERLELVRLHIKQWMVEEGGMPCLNYLTITRCKELQMLPAGLQTLQTLELKAMPEHFVTRVRERYDGHKVPTISIN